VAIFPDSLPRFQGKSQPGQFTFMKRVISSVFHPMAVLQDEEIFVDSHFQHHYGNQYYPENFEDNYINFEIVDVIVIVLIGRNSSRFTTLFTRCA
jgi:hypothetical protein